MSTTIEGINARGYLAGWLNALVGMYSADANAIPDDKWTASFGGCSRPPNSITADAIALLVWVTEAMKGNIIAITEPRAMIELGGDVSTKSAASARLAEVAQEFVQTLNNTSDEQLNKEVTPPWQMPTPLFMLAMIAVSHVWYHDGQLNYVQCLLGDDKVHWMGD